MSTALDTEAAVARCLEAVSLDLDSPAAHDELGQAQFRARRFGEAAASFRNALALDGDLALYHEHLGQALMDDGQLSDATACFQKALSVDPRSFMSLLLLASMNQTAGRLPQANHYFLRAIEADPSSYQAHLRYANALMQIGDASSAVEQARNAISLQPKTFVAYEFLGEALQRKGDFTEAITAYERAISLNPRPRANSFRGLVASKIITSDDQPLVEQMSALIDTPNLSVKDKLLFHSSLAKALDDLGDFGAAFQHLEGARKCAKLLYRGVPFDRRLVAHTGEVCRRRFTKDAMAGYPHGLKSDLPILIVGMPRSGTTLLEQIVSSHPEVGSGGELNYWSESPLSMNAARAYEPEFSNELAVKYRMLLRSFGPGKKRVTDKMPLNFPYLGAIHMLFPNARILHCRRHPVDTCLSLMMNTLALPEPPNYLFEPEDTVFTYNEYLRLMEHWRKVLPADRFLDVDYEEIVSDKEAMTRKIIAFCGLEWDDACLYHDRNTRIVDTPSKWQVRQPIYSTSVARWKRYEPWLGPLRELLDC